MITRQSFLSRIVDDSDPDSFATKLRTKRIRPFIFMIEDVYREYGHVNIIDMGGTKSYWKIIPAEIITRNKVTITIVNLPMGELPADDAHFKFVEADCCDLNFYNEDAFHIAHSNSVIEHVGDWGNMVKFAQEISRMAPRYYVQTPNFWFPVEPHCMVPFFHWLPRPVRLFLISHFKMGNWGKRASIDEAMQVIESARLLNKKMFYALFSDTDRITERLLLLPKSIIAIKK